MSNPGDAGSPEPEGSGEPAHDDELVDLGPLGHPDDEVLDEAQHVIDDAAAHLAHEHDAGDGRFVDGTAEPSDLVAERDEYLEALRRVKAEFENSKKRWSRERAEMATRATSQLAERLLPVLDACDAALSQGSTDVEPIYKTLVDTLTREGLEVMDSQGAVFDPHLHEAVIHEPADDTGGETIVADTLRTGYLWNGQVLRAAMVKVKG